MTTTSETIKEGICIEVSQDKMLGVISFTEPESGGRKLGLEEVEAAIREKGIVRGIKEEVLKEIMKAHDYGHKYIFAQGKAPIDGKDGAIEFVFDVQGLRDFKPKLNEDGTVDLRDLGAVKNAKLGEHLATKIPATSGEEGYNVLGKVLKAKKGREARMPKGRNTKVLEDGVTLVADIDGKLEYDDHNVYINSVYTVNGNLDNSIGNIDFVGSVIIRGNVQSGFTIKAGGSIEVRGSVEDATIIAGEDIFLAYGVQGTNKSKLVAKGSIVAKFIQNTHVEAGGSIVTEAILHSEVTAGDSIKVEAGKGTIVGGSASATHMILAKSIGSPMGTNTTLQMGIPKTVYIEYKQLSEELKEKRESLNKIDQSIKFLLSKMENGKLSAQHQMMLKKFNATRQPVVEEYEEIKARYTKVGEQLGSIKEGIVKCTGSIYPGVRISFGNAIKYIDEKYEGVTIRKVDEEIEIGI